MYLLRRENRKRDEREGLPEPGFQPDTETVGRRGAAELTFKYADDAKGFRYQL